VIALALLLAAQAAPVRVGDTVWVETTIALPGRMIVRPQPWDLGDLGQVLGPPEVILGPDSARIRYPLAIWYPGRQEVTMPGPIVVAPEGSSDTLAARTYRIDVASVLPDDEPPEAVAPKPFAEPVAQSARSPLALLVLEALVGLAALAGWLAIRRGRRRRRATVAAPPEPPQPVDGWLERWAKAGELKAAVDGWAHQLEADAERPEVAAWLERAELAGFRPDAARQELEALLEGIPVASKASEGA